MISVFICFIRLNIACCIAATMAAKSPHSERLHEITSYMILYSRIGSGLAANSVIAAQLNNINYLILIDFLLLLKAAKYPKAPLVKFVFGFAGAALVLASPVMISLKVLK